MHIDTRQFVKSEKNDLLYLIDSQVDQLDPIVTDRYGGARQTIERGVHGK